MRKHNRFWFLRFIEGADGANAGGAPDAGDPPKESGESGSPKEVDWKARAEELEADRDKWKGFARTWEDRAKDNEAAAKQLKDSGGDKPDVEQLEAELADLRGDLAKREAELVAKERKALIATVAAEEGVPKDGIAFIEKYLPDSNDEDAARDLARKVSASGGRGAESRNLGGSTGASKEAVINRVKNL